MPPGKLERFYHKNKVQLIRGGNSYFKLVKKLCDMAERVIHVQTYIFDDDETGKFVADALIRAALRGVHVYILADGYASQELSRDFVRRLRRVGIKFRRFNPILKNRYFYFGRRLHHKVMVVDGRYGLVGGINISNRYNDHDGIPAWLDWALLIEGDLVSALSEICRWRMRSGFGRRKYREMPTAKSLFTVQHTCKARVRINDWVRGKMEITQGYLEMIRTAKSHVIIMSSYFLPGREFRRELKRASQRGVRITVVVASISDVRISKYAERFLYQWLFRNSIEIYEYQPNVLHAKIGTADGAVVTIGSYNINNISAYASIELNIEVRNDEFATNTEERIREIIAKDCKQVTEELYLSRTNLLIRGLQRISYNIIKVMIFFFTFYFRQLKKE